MSQESINREMFRYKKEISNGTTTLEEVLDKLHKTCFAKPNVPDAEFLAACRKYDPNFSPVSSAKERQARAELTERVHQELVPYQIRKYHEVHPDLVVPEGKRIDRHQRILFRGLELPEQQKLLDLIISGDKKAMGEYFYERLLSKKDEILPMLDMDDEQLVAQYFKYKDEIDLIRELENFKNECDFTNVQQTAYDALFNKQGALTDLVSRIDVIASPYYAKFHCENLEMSNEDAGLLNLDLMGLARKHGEALAGSNGVQMGGPTFEFAQDYLALRGYALTALDQKLSDYTASYGAHKDNCVWADANGKLGIFSKVIDTLNDHELIFVDIPGKGIKALHNTGVGYKNCKPEEASAEVVHQHMLRSAEKALGRVEDANPFFLAVFTGSAQYKQMEEQLKTVRETLKTLKYPLTQEYFLKNSNELQELAKSARTYLDYKRGQGLKEENGMLVGRSANERKRIAEAYKALDLVDELNFQATYQYDAKAASDVLQSRQKQKMEKLNLKPRQKAVTTAKIVYTAEERCNSTVEELKAKAELYKNMPACRPGTAGPAIERLQQEAPDAVDMLARFAGKNIGMKEGYANQARESMAKIVLFDYVLRERLVKGQNGDTVIAGTVETALNNGFTASYLAQSPEFQEAIGKITPARMEAFLNDDESRNRKFDAVVQNVLAPVKANVLGNQPVQQPQVELGQNQPQPESKPMVPGAF